jgi:hypothetical protein
MRSLRTLGVVADMDQGAKTPAKALRNALAGAANTVGGLATGPALSAFTQASVGHTPDYFSPSGQAFATARQAQKGDDAKQIIYNLEAGAGSTNRILSYLLQNQNRQSEVLGTPTGATTQALSDILFNNLIKEDVAKGHHFSDTPQIVDVVRHMAGLPSMPAAGSNSEGRKKVAW